jgi:hypothetical protein
MTPSRDDGVTIRRAPVPFDAACGLWFAARGRRLWCSVACRQTAFRRRSQSPVPTRSVMLRRLDRGRVTTVYECPHCESRALGTQRCDDCNCFGFRVGMGGLCPRCEEPVALVYLLPELAPLLEGKP